MVDGVAAVELGMLLFDITPDANSDPPVRWFPAPTETPARLALDAVADTALEQFRSTRRMVGMARSPGRTVRVADTLRRAALKVAEDTIRPAPASYLNVDIGPTRTLATHRVSLDRLLALKERYGVKLNDVVLAACAGALRRFAIDRDEPPIDLRVMVPVNVRRPGEDTGGAGNKITFGFVELPISSDRAEERLQRVVESMNALKRDGRIEGTTILLSAAGLLPEPLKDRAARFAASPRLYNLIVSNLPGPRSTLYACGAKVQSIHPVIPIPDLHALSIGVVTYDEGAHFSFYADPQALPGADSLAIALEDAVIELESSLRPVVRHRAMAGAKGSRRGDVHPRARTAAEHIG
jgi:WS/DGAT/MGAT family acyltransferase